MKMIHIIAGVLALVAGAIALYSAKGSPLHRKSGMLFVVAMLVMAGLGTVMAALMQTNRGTVAGGVLTLYLVTTSLLTVRRPLGQVRGWVTGLMLVALAASAFEFAFGFTALHSTNGTFDRIPAPAYFFFGTIGLLAALLDARMLAAGRIEGAHRLARHLWRMSFALWIAAMSFFIGQAKVFPEPLRNFKLLAIPVLAIFVTMIYWLVRVLRKARREAAAQPRWTSQPAA
jgi:uncharacterized membrane protein